MQIIKVDFSIHKNIIKPRAAPALDYMGLAGAWFLIGFKKNECSIFFGDFSPIKLKKKHWASQIFPGLKNLASQSLIVFFLGASQQNF